MERQFTITKLTVLAVAIVVAILCLSYDNAYGIAVPQMQLTNPNVTTPTTGGSTPTILPGEGQNFGDDFGIDFGDDDPGINDKIPSVPEPGTLVLLGAGLAGIRFLRRKR